MNWKIIPVAIVIVFSIQGCGGFKTVEMSAVLSQDQQKGYMETITSQKKHFVSLAPSAENFPASSDTAFILFIKNCGEDPIDISTQNISAEFFGNTNKGASRSIAVLSYDELMNRLRRKQSRIRNLVISTEWATAPMTPYHTITTYRTEARSYTTTARQMQLVEELVLQSKTLFPGEGGGGLVVCDTNAMNSEVEGKFHVLVSVNGEQHEFTFSRSSKK